MPHIAHTCHTYATHMSHISHTCHTNLTNVTIWKHEKVRFVLFGTVWNGPITCPLLGFRDFRTFPNISGFPRECVLYRPLFMANHFSNDRPNGGPRFEGFLARSPEDQKNTIFRVPKMGNSGIREVSQNWEKCTFQDSQKSRISQESQLFPDFPDFSGIPAFPAFPYVGHCRISRFAGFAGFPQIHAKSQIRACQNSGNGRYPEKYRVPRHNYLRI